MRTELDERAVAELRRALAQMESSAPLAPDLETVAAPVVAPRRRRPDGLVIAGLAVLTVVAVAIPAILVRDRPEPLPGASPPITGAPTTPPTTPPPTVGATTDVEWSYAETPTFVDELVIHQGQFVAVVGGTAMSSIDGAEWMELGRLPADEWASVSHLVSHGDLLLASGADISTDSDGGRGHRPAIWISDDGGRTWNRSVIEETIRDVAPTPLGLVAVGFIDLGQQGDRVRQQGAVWMSDDGMVWTLAWTSDDPEGFSSSADAVIWDESGLIVLGQRGPDQFHEGAGEFTAPTWERVAWVGAEPSDLADPRPVDLPGYIKAMSETYGGQMALVYGFDSSVKDSSAVWASVDGVHWSPIEVDSGSWSYDGVAADDQVTVLTGSTLGASDDPEPTVWLSIDGLVWERLDVSPLPKRLRLDQVVLHDGILVVSGYHDTVVGGYLITGRLSP